VRALVGDATRVLVSADGALNLVPFEALVDEHGAFQVRRYAISYLDSGRDLLRLGLPRPSAGTPLVVANPRFGEPAGTVQAAYFSPLTATGEEAAAIGALLSRATILTGDKATKGALAQARAPAILHIASHGFFLPDAGSESKAAPGTRGMTGTIRSPNPLLRSGIALAGANLTARDGDTGVLTALDASTLNLWGTHLVTLSACDTGVGDVKNGEGVFGLRRAFFLAGAESLVMTLWPVSDYVTRTMMTSYYSGLMKGLGREEALRRAQLATLSGARRHPFYWAGFIEAGDWTPLPSRR
jgi:CHAT domain-containing protein